MLETVAGKMYLGKDSGYTEDPTELNFGTEAAVFLNMVHLFVPAPDSCVFNLRSPRHLVAVSKGKVHTLNTMFTPHTTHATTSFAGIRNFVRSMDSKGYIYGFTFDSSGKLFKQHALSSSYTTLATYGAYGPFLYYPTPTSLPQMQWVSGLVDTFGNIYYGASDFGMSVRTHVIYKMTPKGVRTRLAGASLNDHAEAELKMLGYSGDGGAGTEAKVYGAFAYTLDKNGDLVFFNDAHYEGGYWNKEKVGIRRIDMKTGVITSIAGNSSPCVEDDRDSIAAVDLSLCNVHDIIFDNENNMYFVNQLDVAYDAGVGNRSARIYRVDAKTGIATIIAGNQELFTKLLSSDGGMPAKDARIYAYKLAVDPTGEFLYFVDLASIRRIRLKESVSIPTLATPVVSVYPNPVSAQLTVSGMSVGTKYRIVDIQGRVWQQAALQGNTIEVSSLPVGLYILQSVEGHGVVVKFEKR